MNSDDEILALRGRLFRITGLMTNLTRRKCISLPNKKDYGANSKVIAPVNVQIFIKTTSTK